MKAAPEILFLKFFVEGPEGEDELRKWSVLQDPPKPSRPALRKISAASGDPSMPANFSIDQPIKICNSFHCFCRIRIQPSINIYFTSILYIPGHGHFHGRQFPTARFIVILPGVLSYSAVATAIWQHRKWLPMKGAVCCSDDAN
jgi:hypothetical protein